MFNTGQSLEESLGEGAVRRALTGFNGLMVQKLTIEAATRGTGTLERWDSVGLRLGGLLRNG